MTNREVINQNVGITFDFTKYLIDNPAIIIKLPEKFTLDFLYKDTAIKENKSVSSLRYKKGKLIHVKRIWLYYKNG